MSQPFHSPSRINSLDQFRGYAVAGMFVVNFVSGLVCVPLVWKHNEDYFSYADSILPAFLFAAGMSFRLSWIRRMAKQGGRATVVGFVKRSMMLVLISLIMYGFNGEMKSWSEFSATGILEFLSALFKAGLWEVLAIIGMAQLFLLPLVGRSLKMRAMTCCLFVILHVVISASFNFQFAYGRPNWFSEIWGAGDARVWDGGLFGIFMWSTMLLSGTIAYDILSSLTPLKTSVRFLAIGFVLMALGYAMNCLSVRYAIVSSNTISDSPVLPNFDSNAEGHVLAPPPFVKPPTRELNYWLMSKRVMTAPYVLFSTGFAFVVFALFVAVNDHFQGNSKLLGFLGQNALTAYVLHYFIESAMQALLPADAPLWFGLIMLAVFFAIICGLVRYLNGCGLKLKL